MPRYGVSTFLNEKEMEKVNEALRILGNTTKYKLMQDAILTYCEAIIKENKKNVGENKSKRGKDTETDSGIENGTFESEDTDDTFG